MYSIADMDGVFLDCKISDDEIYDQYVKPKQYKLTSDDHGTLYMQGKWLFAVQDFIQDQIDLIHNTQDHFSILYDIMSNIDNNLVDTIDTHYNTLERNKYELLCHILSKIK